MQELKRTVEQVLKLKSFTFKDQPLIVNMTRNDRNQDWSFTTVVLEIMFAVLVMLLVPAGFTGFGRT